MPVCNECVKTDGYGVVNFNDGRTVCWVCLMAGWGVPVDSPAVDETEAMRIMVAIHELHTSLAKATTKEWFVVHQAWQTPMKYACDVIEGSILAKSERGDYDGNLRGWIEERAYVPSETTDTMVENWDNWYS
jgi:hypothetical protein